MTKTEKTKRCREILNKIASGSIVDNKEDFNFLISIFECHSAWEQKKGIGIKNITVEKTMYGNKCFFIQRIDGTFTDISYTHSITNRTNISKIQLACRNAIRETIVDYRNNNVIFGQTRCEFTNEILTLENTHIDHYDLKFAQVFNNWIKDKDISFLISKLNKTVDGNMETFFTDSKIVKDFINYHNKNTHLRAVSKKANLTFLNN